MHWWLFCALVYLGNSDVVIGQDENLLLVTGRRILHVVKTKAGYTTTEIPVIGVENAVSIDFDPVEGFLYWSDVHTDSINRAMLDGSNQIFLAHANSSDGLVVDWIGRKLYWTDTKTNTIEVANLDGSSRRKLITENLDEPRDIAVDPDHGYMYWTDWGSSPKIERAALDGSNRSVLIDTGLGWPNGIAIDFNTSHLYWCDAKTNKIEVANMDGTGRRTLVSDAEHPFGFGVFGDYVYWTEWSDNGLYRVKKNDGSQRQMVVGNFGRLYGLTVFRLSKPGDLTTPGNDVTTGTRTSTSTASTSTSTTSTSTSTTLATTTEPVQTSTRKTDPDHKPILIDDLHQNITTSLGGDAKFECRLAVADSRAIISWIKHYKVDGSWTNKETGSVYTRVIKTPKSDKPWELELRNVTYEDAGWYTCIAANPSGVTHLTAWLEVTGNVTQADTRLASTTTTTTVNNASTNSNTLLSVIALVLSVLCTLALIVVVVMVVMLIRRRDHDHEGIHRYVNPDTSDSVLTMNNLLASDEFSQLNAEENGAMPSDSKELLYK